MDRGYSGQLVVQAQKSASVREESIVKYLMNIHGMLTNVSFVVR